MIHECAWCGAQVDKLRQSSSGICEECLEEMFRGERITLPSVLRGLTQSALIALGIIVIGLLARGYFDGWLAGLLP